MSCLNFHIGHLFSYKEKQTIELVNHQCWEDGAAGQEGGFDGEEGAGFGVGVGGLQGVRAGGGGGEGRQLRGLQ